MKILYCKSRASTDAVSDRPLFINNCGYYRAIPNDRSTARPHGRKDILLVYVVRGRFDTENCHAGDGDAVLFLPGEAQNYTYRAGEDTLYDWIHFTGNDVPFLLDASGLRSGPRSCRADAHRIGELFRMIFSAYTDDLPCADRYAEGLLRSLLALVGGGNRYEKPNPFRRVTQMMADPSDARTIAEYAAICKMSEAHFIRSFKAATGLTPHVYITHQRILMAKELLEETDTPVGAVGTLCGFSDPLYFSRVFKKETDVSPREYRTRFFENNNE